MQVQQVSNRFNSQINADFSSGKGLLAEMSNFISGQNLIPEASSNFVTDGTGWWTAWGGAVAWNSGTGDATYTKAGTGSGGLRKLSFLTIGKKYLISLRAKSTNSVTNIQFFDGNTWTVIGALTTSFVSYTKEIVAAGVDAYIGVTGGSDGLNITYDDIIIKDVQTADQSGNQNHLSVFGSPVASRIGSLPSLTLNGASLIKLIDNRLYTSPFTAIMVGRKITAGGWLALGNSRMRIQSTASSELEVMFNLVSLLKTVQQDLNVFIVSFDGTTLKTMLNGIAKNISYSTYPTLTTDNTMIEGGNTMQGLRAIIPSSLTDAQMQSISNKLLWLSQNIGKWTSNTGVATDITDANYIGVHNLPSGDISSISGVTAIDATKGQYYNSTTKIIYAPLPQIFLDSSIRDVDVDGTDIFTISDNYMGKYDNEKGIFEARKAVTNGKAISVGDGYIAKADGVNAQFMYVEYRAIKYTQDGPVLTPFTLTDAVYEDMTAPIAQVKLGANAKPDFDFTNMALLFPRNDTGEYIVLNMQLLHKYKEGGTIYPHIHWLQKGAGDVIWKMSYAWVNNGATGDPVFTTITASAANNSVFTYVSGSLAQQTNFPNGIVGTSKAISSLLLVKIWREDNVATGVTGDDAIFWSFDCHVPIDSMGSKTISSKI